MHKRVAVLMFIVLVAIAMFVGGLPWDGLSVVHK